MPNDITLQIRIDCSFFKFFNQGSQLFGPPFRNVVMEVIFIDGVNGKITCFCVSILILNGETLELGSVISPFFEDPKIVFNLKKI